MRPSKDESYLNIAQQAALRSTCRRRKFGAVIVHHDQIISTGYGGAPRGTANCIDIDFCHRSKLGAKKGEHYEYCRAVHAEQNAIIHASRLQMLGATLYLVGLDASSDEPLNDTEPCRLCKRLIVNAGIEKVIARIGGGQMIQFVVDEWRQNNLFELEEQDGELIPVRPPRSLGEPDDEERRNSLLSSFKTLADAVVVQIVSYEQPRHVIGRAAARFFQDNVKSGSSVALSCGETILAMLEELPYRRDLELKIRQLSIEGDPLMIHQAPATLVGLLWAKSSPASHVYGLQLPPAKLLVASKGLRAELAGGEFLRRLREQARNSEFVLTSIGSAGEDSPSFWAMAQAATDGKFAQLREDLGIVGEMNNQVFDSAGKDRTQEIPGLSEHALNILSLDDLREMAKNPQAHKVVSLATGENKALAMKTAIATGLVNVVITGKDDADRLLAN